MLADPRVIDIDEAPELVQLTERVLHAGVPILLRRGGREVAVIAPVGDARAFEPGRSRTEHDREAFLRAAGAWRGIVDEEFLEEVYQRRSISSRPPVEL
jgi:hypothetical protein